MNFKKLAVCVFVLDSDMGSLILTTQIYLQFQFPQVGGLTSPQYTVAIRLSPDPNLPSGSLSHQQSARTCGSSSDHLSSELELVKWNEIFFFKVDDPVCRMFFFLARFSN